MAITGIAATPAPADEVIVYNGFRFPQGALTESFVCDPVYDASGRTIIYNKITVGVSCILAATNGPVDPLANTALVLLSQPGGAFYYLGRGLGDFTVQVGGAKDCVWGPSPKGVSIKPYKNKSMKLTFTVELHIPICPANARYDGPMEFNYSTSVDINSHGLSTRTYKGFIRIAQTRLGQAQRTVFRSADEWREKINPPLLTGFRRTPGTFDLSADKCRLDFTIRDEEFGGLNHPVPDVVEVEAEHSIGTSQPGRLQEWIGSLRATYTIKKGSGLGVMNAIDAFGRLAEDRLGAFIAKFGGGGGGGAAAVNIGAGVGAAVGVLAPPRFGPLGNFLDFGKLGRLARGAAGGVLFGGSSGPVAVARGQKTYIVPVSFRASDPTIYGEMRVGLELTYRIAGATLPQILESGGLWRAVPERGNKPLGPNGEPAEDDTWDVWAISMRELLGPRGNAGLLLFTPGEEQLVDLCAGLPGEVKKGSRKKRDRAAPARSSGSRAAPSGIFTPPPPPVSFLSYVSSVRVEEDSGVVAGRVLPSSAIPSPGAAGRPWDVLSGLPSAPADRGVGITPPTGGTAAGGTFFQRRTAPMTTLILTGYATRAGYAIPKPALLRAGNVNLIEMNDPAKGDFFETGIVGNGGLNGSLPIVGAKWQLRYLVPAGATGATPIVPNDLAT